MDEASPYAPPQAKLVPSGALSDCETWTYPLRYQAIGAFSPRLELRDAHQRLLWLAELKPLQARVTLQGRVRGEPFAADARMRSFWKQLWVLQDPDTKEEFVILERIGGCLPNLFALRPAWTVQAQGARERAVFRSTGPPPLRWWASRGGAPSPYPMAASGLQARPESLLQREVLAADRATFATVHASAGSPAFLRVRRENRRRFLIERLEGEATPEAERLAHQVVFWMLTLGLLN